MRIALLSRAHNRLYSNRRLVEAAIERGHEIEHVHTLNCYMDIASNSPSVHLGGEELPFFDAVIPRIGASVTFYGTAVLRQFEVMGSYPLNESVAISRSRDKLRSLQILSRADIGLPLTGFAHSTRGAPPTSSIKSLVFLVECAKPVRGRPMSARDKICSDRNLSRDLDIATDSLRG